MPVVSRRNFIRLAGFGAAALTFSSSNAAPTNGRYSKIQVDMSAFDNNEYGVQADWVRKDLNQALAKFFPARAGRGAPRLIVQPQSLSLGDYNGDWDSGTDYLYGQALVVTTGGTVTANYPIKLSLPPAEAGAWYLQNIDRLRIKSLCNAFAGWVARYAG